MARNTRAQVKRIHARQPHLTGAQIAAKLGVSRQRISGIAKEEGIKLPRGEPMRPLGNCRICRRKLRWPGTTTHKACHIVQLNCAGCGKAFFRGRFESKRSGNNYHSRRCFALSRARTS